MNHLNDAPSGLIESNIARVLYGHTMFFPTLCQLCVRQFRQFPPIPANSSNTPTREGRATQRAPVPSSSPPPSANSGGGPGEELADGRKHTT
jgi:hypothetical protein